MNIQQPSISIIEDNQDLLNELVFFLQQNKFKVWSATSAEQFWKKLHLNNADIVIIDIGLPGEDGFKVLEHLKAIGNMGLIVVSARGNQRDKLHGLNLGADHYFIKPVNFSELVESIRTLWERVLQQKFEKTAHSSQVLDPKGKWRLKSATRGLVSPDGEQLKLSQQEYFLLSSLMLSANEVFTKAALFDLMFGYDEGEPEIHRLDVILSRLRKKAKAADINIPIRSIFGKGFVFVGEAEQD